MDIYAVMSNSSNEHGVGVVTTLRAGLPRNCGSVTDRTQEAFLQSLHARSAGYQSCYSVGTDGFSTVYISWIMKLNSTI